MLIIFIYFAAILYPLDAPWWTWLLAGLISFLPILGTIAEHHEKRH
jgi:hypothetical protein